MFTSIQTILNTKNEIKIDANWSGVTNFNWNHEENESRKIIIEPYVGLSFFPYFNIEGEELIKLFVGYQIKSLNNNLNVNQLFQKRENWNLAWGFNINNNFKKDGCWKIDSDKKNYRNIISSNSTKALVNKKDGLLFKKSCFLNNNWNEIKIWWYPTNNLNKLIEKNGGTLRIRFFIPKNIKKKFNLIKNINIKNPYFYFIKTYFDQKTILIKEIFSEELAIKSLIKEEYIDNIFLDKLMNLTYLNFSINNQNFLNFIIYFDFNLIWNEIRKFKNNLSLNIDPDINLEIISLLKKEKNKLNLLKVNEKIEKYILNIKNINIPFLKFDYILKINNDALNQKINFKKNNLENFFNSSFNFKFNFIDLNLNLKQKSLFKNNTFNTKINIKTDFDFNELTKIFENIFFIPNEILYKLKNNNYKNFNKHYLELKKT